MWYNLQRYVIYTNIGTLFNCTVSLYLQGKNRGRFPQGSAEQQPNKRSSVPILENLSLSGQQVERATNSSIWAKGWELGNVNFPHINQKFRPSEAKRKYKIHHLVYSLHRQWLLSEALPMWLPKILVMRTSIGKCYIWQYQWTARLWRVTTRKRYSSLLLIKKLPVGMLSPMTVSSPCPSRWKKGTANWS